MPEAQKPTIGRIVHYVLTAEQAEQINQRRCAMTHDPSWPSGAQAHVGNHASAGDELPLVITCVWPDEGGEGVDGVNGQVLLDGNDQLWITSALPSSGPVPGCWHWPERV